MLHQQSIAVRCTKHGRLSPEWGLLAEIVSLVAFLLGALFVLFVAAPVYARGPANTPGGRPLAVPVIVLAGAPLAYWVKAARAPPGGVDTGAPQPARSPGSHRAGSALRSPERRWTAVRADPCPGRRGSQTRAGRPMRGLGVIAGAEAESGGPARPAGLHEVHGRVLSESTRYEAESLRFGDLQTDNEQN
jgi:hypothetical protein